MSDLRLSGLRLSEDDLTDDELLVAGLSELDIHDESIFANLKKHIEEIELFNSAYGLVKISNRRELIVKHILDSLAPLKIIKKLLFAETANEPAALKAADVGSGAGFPGIPLSLCLGSVEFTLIERMGRRADFLRNCAAILGSSNFHIAIEETEMEKAAPSRFDMVVFRAFRPLEPGILKALLNLLNRNGFLAAWKGRMENINTELLMVEKTFPGLKREIIPVTVPFLDEERHLVVIKR